MSDLEKKVRGLLRKSGKNPLTLDELRRYAGVNKAKSRAFQSLIGRLESQGDLIRQKNKVMLTECADAKTATIVKLKRTFGFARVDDAEHDIFIPGKRLLGALPGDRVLLQVVPAQGEGGLEEGEVLRILTRVPVRLSGSVTYNESHELEFRPDNTSFSPVLIERGGLRVVEGEKVVARLVSQGDSHRDCRAVVESSFGTAEFAKNCCAAILDGAGIEREFAPEVLEEAENVAARSIEEEITRRLDLRDWTIFTIDGEDTKDIDDAISVEQTETGWLLGVHIADVSHYVTPKSHLDRNAFYRGTSVYFADSVIPMLPPALSNGACSLNPGEDKLAFSALLTLDPDGALLSYRFRKSVIRSRVRGVYSEINRLFSGEQDAALLEKYQEVGLALPLLRELAKRLAIRKKRRGALSLSSTESKILVDSAGHAIDILPRTQGESERLIEEMMLLANEAAATLALEWELPFIYRIHEAPSPDKLMMLKTMFDAVGLPSAALVAGVTPSKLSSLLEDAKDHPCAVAINAGVLRAMQKARYEAQNLGHYGLALSNYTHFTSPIRRYPDLAIHRILSACPDGQRPTEIGKKLGGFVAAVAKQSSVSELTAMGAERLCEDCYKAEYMQRHLGEVFEGMISSAPAHGIYVQLDNSVEGLVKYDALGEGMLYDGRMQYCSEDGKRCLRVGDRIMVQVAAATVSTGRIEFVLAD